MRIPMLLITILLVAACATGITEVTGPVGKAIETDDVRVIYQRPDCDFIEVARIDMPGNYFNRVRLIDAMRAEAAKLGAEILQIIDLETVGSSEFRGSARALHCR